MTNPYEFKDLNEDVHTPYVKPELLVDSILVFIHRIIYLFLCMSAYIAFFIYDSFIVGKTIATVSAILYIIDGVSAVILIHLATSRSQINKKIVDLHRDVTGNK